MSYCNFVSAHEGRCKCTFSALQSCSYLFLHLLLPNIVILNEINGDGDGDGEMFMSPYIPGRTHRHGTAAGGMSQTWSGSSSKSLVRTVCWLPKSM